MLSIKKNISKKYLQSPIRLIAFLWLLLLSVILMIGAGRFIIYIYPISIFCISILLIRANFLWHIELNWWILFLAPIIRRVIDYQSGFLTPGPWSLAARISGIVFIFPIVSSGLRLKKNHAPFVICSLCVLYGFLIGMIYSDIQLDTLIVSSMGWINPILFSLVIFCNWHHYPTFKKIAERVFKWGVIIVSIYGIVQFLIVPSWDVFWLNNTTATTFGKPYPFEIRVYSTLNSPQNCAIMLSSGILVLISSRKTVNLIISTFGILALILTKARGPWAGFIIGLFILLTSLKPRIQIKLIIGTVLLGLIIIPIIISIDPIYDLFSLRLQTFHSIESDNSFQARLDGFYELLNIAMTEFIGRGFGTSINTLKNDNGLIKSLLSLGWIGFIPYLLGVLSYLFRILKGPEQHHDSFAAASSGIVLGIFAQLLLIPIFGDFNGILFWGFLGLRMAAYQYYQWLGNNTILSSSTKMLLPSSSQIQFTKGL